MEYCTKKYFLNYYPHVLKDEHQELRLETLLLKNLKSLEMWIGEKTHHLLSDYLRALKKGEITDEKIQSLKDEMTQEMTKEFELSKNRDYSTYDRDQKFGLSEHYYGENIDKRLQESIDRVMNNLDVFIASKWHEKVEHYFKSAKSTYIENPRERNFDGMKVSLSHIPALKDINVMASPDFGVVFGDDKYLIIDWKTGQEKMENDGITDQLKIYALKLLLKSHLDIEKTDIEAYEVYLPSLHSFG